MSDYGSGNRRRHSLYVKQNKAYQLLLAALIIAFVLISAVVINNTFMQGGTSRTWRDNILIRMIIEKKHVREGY